jgi:hypothetical protein
MFRALLPPPGGFEGLSAVKVFQQAQNLAVTELDDVEQSLRLDLPSPLECRACERARAPERAGRSGGDGPSTSRSGIR